MKKVFTVLVFFAVSLFFFSCQIQENDTRVNAQQLHEWNQYLEEAIVNDFFSPPVAGRIYAYSNLAAYEVIAQLDSDLVPISKSYEDLIIPTPKQQFSLHLASITAFYEISIELVYSIEGLDSQWQQFKETQINNGISENEFKVSANYGKQVAKTVLAWAKKDGYLAMRSYPKHTPLQMAGKWIPTPPDYTAALEPHWNKLRPFLLDSAQQFKPEAPTNYDLDTSSQFYKETIEVYAALNNNTAETEAIAKFWDCNPLVKKHQGHVTFAEKKLTPGGHWMNIARMAMKKKSFSLLETAQLYTVLSIGMHEAFISCWDEKYRSNYIRPVTVIQEYIDPKWSPILYTPNFPEYPSGHSVVSGSAATILTHFMGDNFAFTDSTEVPYGMPPRSFGSFYEASDEAAISRLYGGIHFMPAIENGKTQGRKVGQHILKSLDIKK